MFGRLVALALVLLGGGCDRGARDRKLVYGEPSAVEAVLAKHGVSAKVNDCENIRIGESKSVTRGLSCTTTLSYDDRQKLVTGLPLAPATPKYDKGYASGSCNARPAFAAAGVEILGIAGRPKTANGMEYFTIYVVPATGATCIETQYAWS